MSDPNYALAQIAEKAYSDELDRIYGKDEMYR